MQLRVTNPTNDKVYTLEYTRETVKAMERTGFKLDAVGDAPMTMIPALFAGAFMANHRNRVKQEEIDFLFKHMTNKDELLQYLLEMYNEPVAALMDGPDEDDAGKAEWSVT